MPNPLSFPKGPGDEIVPNHPTHLSPQVDVLQAEVTALKSLVISSTPTQAGGKWRRHSSEHLTPCPECGLFDCDAAGLKRADHAAPLLTPETLDDEAEVGTGSQLFRTQLLGIKFFL